MYLPVEPGQLIEGPENRGCTVPDIPHACLFFPC